MEKKRLVEVYVLRHVERSTWEHMSDKVKGMLLEKAQRVPNTLSYLDAFQQCEPGQVVEVPYGKNQYVGVVMSENNEATLDTNIRYRNVSRVV